MAPLARNRTRLLFLLPSALLCLALAASGCGLFENDGTSQVPGVALVEEYGAGVAAWSPDGRAIAVPAGEGIELSRPGGARLRRIEAPPPRSYGRTAPIEWMREGRFLRYVTIAGPDRGHRFWQTVVFPDGSGLDQTPLLSGNEDRPEEAVISPDGRQVLFKERGDGGTDLLIANADGTDARRLAHFLFLNHPRFSPDGKQVAFAAATSCNRGAGIYTVPTTGGKPRPVIEPMPVDGPTWSPDGRWLTYSTYEGEIRRIHPDGSGDEAIAGFGDREEVRGLVWSPDGHTLLYSARPFPTDYAD